MPRQNRLTGRMMMRGLRVRIHFPPAESQERTRIPRPGSGAGFRVMGLVDRALRLNPSFARGWYLSGILRDPGVVTLAPARIERFAAVLDARRPKMPPASFCTRSLSEARRASARVLAIGAKPPYFLGRLVARTPMFASC